MIDKPFTQPRLMSSQAHFSRVPRAEIPRSVFNRSHQLKTTFNENLLIPIYVDEVLPGDTFKMKVTTFARMATPIVPIMDNLYADIHFWYVPNRLVWSHFEKFCGSQDNPTDTTDYLLPVVQLTNGVLLGDLNDYFGIPLTSATTLAPVSLHHRAYNLIWNDWYRDQNLNVSVSVPTGDGPDSYTAFSVLSRNKRHDYFTSCLPWTQKGPSVLLPLGDFAPITSMNLTTGALDGTMYARYGSAESGSVAIFQTTAPNTVSTSPNLASGTQALYWPDGHGTGGGSPSYLNVADLSVATGATINALREAFQLQRLFERDARGGTRFVEMILSHFGVSAPDFRLQRPEFIGGGSVMINTAPIPQTSATGETGGATPQGNLAAMATFSHHGVGFNKSFVEHGVLIGLVSVRADMTYQQGMHRMWSRSTRYDMYWPALAHLGEQAVLNSEIYTQGTGADTGVFGYQERYAEYRYKPSLITGQFRSTASGPLDIWHLAQDFGALPTLGASFIQESVPVSRVVATPSEPHFLFDAVFDLKCARPMPVYSVPGLIDHF